MGSIKKIFFFAFFVGSISSAGVVLAQVDSGMDEDVLLFDDMDQDFVLPSYFDGVGGPNIESPASAPVNAQQAPADVDILQEIFGENMPIPTSPAPAPVAAQTGNVASGSEAGKVFYPQTQVTYSNQKKEPLLTPLPPLPELREPPIPPRVRVMPAQTYSTKVLAHETGKSKVPVTLPRDVRLQFSPDSSQLSQPIIKWITAYALHAQKDPRLVIVLRVSQYDWNLQRARLNLIVKTLMQRGLSAKQIKVYRSDRDADTLVVGYSEHPDQTKIVVPGEVVHKIKEQKNFSW